MTAQKQKSSSDFFQKQVQSDHIFIAIHCASHIVHFYKLKVCDDPASNQYIGTTFSSLICSLNVSASHFGNFSNILNFFIIAIFVMVICAQQLLVLLLQKKLWLSEGFNDD